MLEKDPTKRLGTLAGGVQELMDHPWFSSIDWKKLENREIKSPYKPVIDDERDVKYFNTEFTQMKLSPEILSDITNLE